MFHRATEGLRKSGLAEHALKTGDRAPAFTLNNQDGKSISSAELLAKARRKLKADRFMVISNATCANTRCWVS